MDLGMPWWAALIRMASLTTGLWLVFVMVPVLKHDWKFLETWKKCRETAVAIFAFYCISMVVEGVQREILPGFSSLLRLTVLALLVAGVWLERRVEVPVTDKSPH